MELNEAISLIHPLPVQEGPSVWADLGCGSGLFTAALAHGLSPGSTVYAVDKDPVRLDASLFPGEVDIKNLRLDFTREALPVTPLNGILMANALHFVEDKPRLLSQLMAFLKPEAVFIVVEYDTDKAIPPWVPYPLPFRALHSLFVNAGFSSIQKSGERPSRYNRANIYGALITSL